ncbi:MAG: sarcosine oxidase subunit alpha family protein [Alphaproteobacteria bacterium]|nr:sarcosine oxidase subunit alpha family protein [Alphaproteobacteria bacterium]
MSFRTPTGGRIDRNRVLNFTFDGRAYTGHHGDTLASALLAKGVHLMGRSFKYHRPRGVLAAGIEEPNALVHVDRGGGRDAPNLRATQVELYEGLVARSQNRSPSLAFDLGAVAGLLSRFLPAGFYYKTFMWPASFWKRLYEPAIRAAAGLGRAPTAADPDRYLHRYAHCDVLIVGAGPAGLTAARAAAATGQRVMICDEQPELGGSLRDEPGAVIGGRASAAWLAAATTDLASRGNVTVLTRATAFGWYPDNLIGIAERVTDHIAMPDPNLPRERLWQVRASEVIIATGAHERPLVFPDNDRPGIMLAGAARAFLHRHGVLPGRRAVVATACDSAYAAALDLHAAGVTIAAIADLRANPTGAAIEAARAAGIPVRTGCAITGSTGRLRVTGALLGSDWVACDTILMSAGWTPSLHLQSQSRGKLRFDAATASFLPMAQPGQRSVGACAGEFDLAAILGVPVSGAISPNGSHTGLVPGASAKRAFVDFQNDVTARDLALATQEGFRSIEHVKRYTTTGMATDQGKTSNINALAIVAGQLGNTIPEVGLTTFRPPYSPVTFGTIAGASRGDLFDPERRAPMHDWAAAHGAVFEDVGTWKRAWYFPRGRETMHDAVARECRAVRNAVGIFDASTLGKIEVVGPDAAEFLNRLYTNSWKKLGVGRCRYGLMLSEAGFVWDDGVVGRIAEDRFHVTTTTGGAARVLNHMEDYLQTEFPELLVWLTSTTEQWAVIAVQGPDARALIAPLVAGIDLSPEAFPHMSIREGTICGVPTRLFRVSFTGELGFEINVPAEYGPAVWEALMAQEAPTRSPTPYGTEAMHVLRAEKGFVIVGQETDGTVTPDDLGLSGMIARSKPDFVGKRSLRRPDMVVANRKQLVGLLTEKPDDLLEEGAQIVEDPRQPIPMRMIGHVTSSYPSATLGRSIAMALVEGGRARMGSTLYVPMPGQDITVRVVEPIFYDRTGARLDG